MVEFTKRDSIKGRHLALDSPSAERKASSSPGVIHST